MLRMRLSYVVPGLLALLFVYTSIATADLYTYRDAQGQRHFTNDASTIPTANRQQAAATRRKTAAARPTTSTHQPIHTDQFERLQLGMSGRDVAQYLGTPAVKITQVQRQINDLGTHHTPASRMARFELWYYPGTPQGLATRLIFHDGVLRQKFQ
jgi:hypothetical protein